MQPRPKVRDVATGKWRGILAGFGLSEKALSGKHGPCPMCGGKDRFRFDDKEGRGTWFCGHCGAGDGVALVMAYKGMDFLEAAREIELAAGVVQPSRVTPEANEAQKLAKLRQVWTEASPLVHGDEAMAYLAGRGLALETSPRALRLHPELPYYDAGQVIGRYPAILAQVVGPDGDPKTIHRTYMHAGKKAPVESPKKLMPGKRSEGAAVRLSRVGWHLGIAEGIETALAASILFSVPTWSTISAHGIETFEPPDGVKRITIFADNDDSFTGQAAAYACACRLRKRGLEVDVKIPAEIGDWLDVLNSG